MEKSYKIIFTFVIIFLITHLTSWLIFVLNPIKFPKYIPKTPLNISGIFILITTIFIWIQYIKIMKRYYSELGFGIVLQQALFISFISGFSYQFVRISYLGNLSGSDKFVLFYTSTITSTLFSTGVAFLVASKMLQKDSKLFYTGLILILLLGYFFSIYFR
jgi:hypothetical protein